MAALELKLHPGDEYVGSWEPESLQVLVGTYWSTAPNASCQLIFVRQCTFTVIHTRSNTISDW